MNDSDANREIEIRRDGKVSTLYQVRQKWGRDLFLCARCVTGQIEDYVESLVAEAKTTLNVDLSKRGPASDRAREVRASLKDEEAIISYYFGRYNRKTKQMEVRECDNGCSRNAVIHFHKHKWYTDIRSKPRPIIEARPKTAVNDRHLEDVKRILDDAKNAEIMQTAPHIPEPAAPVPVSVNSSDPHTEPQTKKKRVRK